MPFVLLAGVTVNGLPLQTVSWIVVITGTGYTVTVKVKVASTAACFRRYSISGSLYCVCRIGECSGDA